MAFGVERLGAIWVDNVLLSRLDNKIWRSFCSYVIQLIDIINFQKFSPKDGGDPSLVTEVDVTAHVLDTADTKPRFSLSEYNKEVPENLPKVIFFFFTLVLKVKEKHLA